VEEDKEIDSFHSTKKMMMNIKIMKIKTIRIYIKKDLN
jgi:hypothetical protein